MSKVLTDRWEALTAALESRMDLAVFSSKAEYDTFLDLHRNTLDARWICAERIDHLCRGSSRLHGWCTVCGRPAEFSYRSGPETGPNLREELECRHCGLNARLRCAFSILSALHPAGTAPRIYITEQASPAYRWLTKRFPDVTGSEYFGADQLPALQRYLAALGIDENSIRFEDVTRLSFANESFDVVLSFDVLEHVPNYREALHEFARVLRPGGNLVLTVPFLDNQQETETRAGLDSSGMVEHYLEPEYHGDPVSGDGVLAYYNFAWDLLGDIRTAGFSKACWLLSWSYSSGFLGSLWTVVARR